MAWLHQQIYFLLTLPVRFSVEFSAVVCYFQTRERINLLVLLTGHFISEQPQYVQQQTE